MTDIVTALTTVFTADALWGALEPLVPIIGTFAIFGLSLYFLRKVTKGGVRGGKIRF